MTSSCLASPAARLGGDGGRRGTSCGAKAGPCRRKPGRNHFVCTDTQSVEICRGSHAGVCWVERRALSSLLPRTCTAVRSSRPSSPTPGSVRPRTSACRSCSCSTPATSCKTGSRGGPSCTGQQGERPGNRTAGTSTGSTGPRTAQDHGSQKLPL